MSGRAHSREFFYKYASFDTALRVIGSKSFRWSSPAKFNDPFDTQTGFAPMPEPEEFGRQLNAAIQRAVFTDMPLLEGGSGLFTTMLLRLRQIRDRMPRDEVIAYMQQSSQQSAQLAANGVEALNSTVVQQMLHSRVFCVSELHDNVVMWSHYAENHHGVVFRLKCLDELDHLLLAARKVEYAKAFLKFPAAREYAMHLTGEKPLDFVSLVWNSAFLKHQDWSYESEWRVHVPLLGEPAGDGYSSYREPFALFDCVYLGCRMDDTNAAKVTEAVQAHLPNTKIFRAARSKKSFDLVFEPVRV